MPVPVGGGMAGPSTFDKLKMGAMMGGSVGLIIGFIFGATNIIRFGPGPNGMLRTLGQYMIGSATTFGFFMSIGTTIRTDSSPIAAEAFARASRPPMIIPAQRFRRPQIKTEERA
ncbi:reactive mitochondrial oxygen species modulator 1-domain-containing protein [Cryomyces antarcticus]